MTSATAARQEGEVEGKELLPIHVDNIIDYITQPHSNIIDSYHILMSEL